MKWIMIAVVAVLFAGCFTPMINSTSNVVQNGSYTIGMGDVMCGVLISYYEGGPARDRWELSYTGKTGNIIKIQYKEYKWSTAGWLIKDAFNQLLEYDLSSSKIVTFRDFKCEILEANGPQLSFKVLSVPQVTQQ